MATNYIAPTWRMPENTNKSKLSNYSINFNGSSDVINLGSGIQLSGNKSISAWVYVQPGVDQTVILGAAAFPVYYFWLNNALSKVYIRDASGGPTQLDTGTLSEGWAHFCITGDGTTATLYINGTSTDTGTDRELDIQNIGAAPAYYFDGKIAEITIFNYILSTDQITYLYNLNSPMAITGVKPVAYYSLGDNSNPTTLTGYPNQAIGDHVFYLNGSDNYLQFSEVNYLGSGSVSWSIWERPAAFTSNNYGYFFAGASQAKGGFAMSEGGTGGSHFAGQVYYYDGSAVYHLGQALTAEVWNHLVLVFEEGTGSIKMYRNGSLVSTTTGIPEPYDATFNTIGRYNGGSGSPIHYLKGEISNWSAFDSALSLSQVQTIYNNGVPGDISSLSPKSWWKFDGVQDTFDGSNWTIKDYGSAAVDATSYNMTSTSLIAGDLSNNTAYSNYSIQFDGTDYFDDGTTSGVFNGATSFSVSGWMRIASGASESIMIGAWQSGSTQFLIRWRSPNTNSFEFYINDGGTKHSDTAGLTITVDTWYHVVGTWDGSNMRMYVDGVAYPTTAASGTLNSVSIPNWIGRYLTTYANGQLSNIALWKNTTLTQAQITEIYNAGVATDLSSFSGTAPTHWYPMDGGKTYYNGTTIVVRDAIGTQDFTGVNLVQENIIGNAPGSSLNGTGTNLDISDLKGDMSGSTKNSYSINMADYGDPNGQGVTPANSGRTTSVPG